MKKLVLITRPKNQSQEVTKYLEDNGFNTFIEPIFLVENLQISKKILQNLQNQDITAIILTSKNAAKTAFETINKLNKILKFLQLAKKQQKNF